MPPAPPRKRSRLFAAALAAAATLSLGGCGDMFTQVYQRGYIPPEGALEQVPLGATQEQVLIVLGTPSTVATVSGEVFYYISQRAEQKLAFLPQDVTNQRVIAVYFDKNRRVAAARQLRAQGRQGVRLRQPHHADRRRRAELHQLHLRHHQAARQLSVGRAAAHWTIAALRRILAAKSDRWSLPMTKMPIISLPDTAKALGDSGGRVNVLWQQPDSLVFMARGREYRTEFHINPSDEVMYPVKGDLRLHYRTEDGKEEIAEVPEGSVIYTPAGTPHSPRFAPDAYLLVVERKRREGEIDRFQWFCPKCDSLLHEVKAVVDDYKNDPVSKAYQQFFDSEEARTCKKLRQRDAEALIARA